VAVISKLYKNLHSARQLHAQTCGANILAFVISPFDFARFELDPDETFAGVPIISHPSVQPARVRVQCSNGHGNPGGRTATEEAPVDDDLEVVSPDVERARERERELLPTGEVLTIGTEWMDAWR
jgi:hypothetical protein